MGVPSGEGMPKLYKTILALSLGSTSAEYDKVRCLLTRKLEVGWHKCLFVEPRNIIFNGGQILELELVHRNNNFPPLTENLWASNCSGLPNKLSFPMNTGWQVKVQSSKSRASEPVTNLPIRDRHFRLLNKRDWLV